MSGDQTAPPVSTIDPYEYLQIIQNSDGTIKRLYEIPSTPAAPDHNGSTPVITKDVTLNPNHNTWVRIFLPRQALDNTSTNNSVGNTKLPLIVYYHGGGFILLSADSTMNHDFCFNMALQLSAVIVSVEYRLAPEHRLPAAYDDAVEALHWIKCTQEKLLRDFADYSKCFLMGTSAGGNIAYHVGLRASTAVGDFEPLKIKGLILHHPFFGGSKRTESELRLLNAPVLPLCSTDLMWKLALPIGVDRDHEYCNPTVGDGFDQFDQIRELGWWVVVTGCDGDPLIDRQMELVEMLKKKGVKVEAQFNEGDYHGVELMDATKANALSVFLRHFLEKCC
ncbi:carboxylesterase 1-like [Quercus robur]|uniref:carboxylesterase 1-like n=1 Tax=Quercus robur TaxID=38942 RepID=UPI0021621B28|nr:carboxylesterase 1-like [Quercus robur]